MPAPSARLDPGSTRTTRVAACQRQHRPPQQFQQCQQFQQFQQ